jgi:hypothetical protein
MSYFTYSNSHFFLLQNLQKKINFFLPSICMIRMYLYFALTLRLFVRQLAMLTDLEFEQQQKNNITKVITRT